MVSRRPTIHKHQNLRVIESTQITEPNFIETIEETRLT